MQRFAQGIPRRPATRQRRGAEACTFTSSSSGAPRLRHMNCLDVYIMLFLLQTHFTRLVPLDPRACPSTISVDVRPERQHSHLVGWIDSGRAFSSFCGAAFWIASGTLEGPVACETCRSSLLGLVLWTCHQPPRLWPRRHDSPSPGELARRSRGRFAGLLRGRWTVRRGRRRETVEWTLCLLLLWCCGSEMGGGVGRLSSLYPPEQALAWGRCRLGQAAERAAHPASVLIA